MRSRARTRRGAVQLLDTGSLQPRVGVVAASSGENQPLLSDVFYIERALAPFAEVDKAGISALLARHVSVLMLADVGRIPGADEEKVSRFVSDGGVLIRFAGDRMTQGADALVPVPLRVGGRYLGSAMGLGPAAASGAVRRHQSVQRAWHSRRSDGVAPGAGRAVIGTGRPRLGAAGGRHAAHHPARAQGRGWIVLFHITASPAWSSLPLSGLYVDMLKRLLALAAGTPASELAGLTSLPR